MKSGKMLLIKSLNIGLPRRETFHGNEYLTGICKQAVSGPQRLTRAGFGADGVGDLRHHGGPDKAVCVYSLDHYPYWEGLLGIRMPSAAFGENLSVTGLHEEDVCIGDIFGAGSALVQVSQPRQPCRTLAARYGRDDLIRLVIDSGFTGWYFRVLQEGDVAEGDSLMIKQTDPAKVSVAFAGRTFHHDRKNRDAIEQVLAVQALSASWQKSFRELRERCS